MYERILAEMAVKGIRFVAELERKAGLSNGSIKNIKYGHIPSSDRLARIADVLGVSVQYLLTGETDIDPTEEPPEVTQKRKQIYCLLEGRSPTQFENAIHYLNYLKGLDEK